jgi:hypothetical protein
LTKTKLMNDVLLGIIITCVVILVAIIVAVVYRIYNMPNVADPDLEQAPPQEPIWAPPPLPRQQAWTSPELEPMDFNEEGYGFDNGLNLKYGDLCQICQDSMSGKHTISRLTNCNHAFHKNCIGRWFARQIQSNNTFNCPVCRDTTPNTIVETKLVSISTRIMNQVT